MKIKIELNHSEQTAIGTILNAVNKSLDIYDSNKSDCIRRIHEYFDVDESVSRYTKYGSVSTTKNTIDISISSHAVDSVSRFVCKTAQRCGGMIHHFIGILHSMKDMCHAIRSDLKVVENELTVPVESCKFCYQVIEAANKSFVVIYKYDGYDVEFYELRHVSEGAPENLTKAVIEIAKEGCPKVYKMTISEIEELFVYDLPSVLVEVGNTIEKLDGGDIYAVVEREYHDLKFAVMYMLAHGADPDTDIKYVNHYFPTCISCLMGEDENENLEELIEEAEDFFIHESRDSEELPDECEFTLTYREAEEEANRLLDKFCMEMKARNKQESSTERFSEIEETRYRLVPQYISTRPYVVVYEYPYPCSSADKIKVHAIATPIGPEYADDNEQELYEKFKDARFMAFDTTVSDPNTAMVLAQDMVNKLYKEWKGTTDSAGEDSADEQ